MIVPPEEQTVGRDDLRYDPAVFGVTVPCDSVQFRRREVLPERRAQVLRHDAVPDPQGVAGGSQRPEDGGQDGERQQGSRCEKALHRQPGEERADFHPCGPPGGRGGVPSVPRAFLTSPRTSSGGMSFMHWVVLRGHTFCSHGRHHISLLSTTWPSPMGLDRSVLTDPYRPMTLVPTAAATWRGPVSPDTRRSALRIRAAVCPRVSSPAATIGRGSIPSAIFPQ